MSRHRASGVSTFVVLVLLLVVFVVVQRQSDRLRPRRQPIAATPTRREFHRYGSTVHRHRRRYGRESGRNSISRASCDTLGVTCDSEYLTPWQEPIDNGCTPSMRNGYPVPDPRCTPGGVDPSVTAETLRDRHWRTGCIRNCQTSEAEKHVAYTWYNLRRPRANSGDYQVCELDHLVPLELGGADGMGNIWPECGPNGAVLEDRYFKMKDRVENYLAEMVKVGRIPLNSAQRGIAANWTQYLPAANRYCASSGRC